MHEGERARSAGVPPEVGQKSSKVLRKEPMTSPEPPAVVSTRETLAGPPMQKNHTPLVWPRKEGLGGTYHAEWYSLPPWPYSGRG